MPTLTKPQLDLRIRRPENQVDVDVTTTVRFNTVELNEIRLLGVRYRLACRILEQDPGSDEQVHRFVTRDIPPGSPEQLDNVLSVRFSQASLPMSRFDMDPSALNRDEIYARVTLVNTHTGATVTADSEIVEAQFAT